MTAAKIKAGAAQVECPNFDTPSFVSPPPLAEATVALVTSASLHHPTDDGFPGNETGYRVI